MKKQLFLIFGLLLLTFSVNADYRSYVWTYEFTTMPQGETELEIYSTLSLADQTNKSSAKWEKKLEIEHGLTKWWDFSLYFVFSQSTSTGDFRFDKIQLRTRLKLIEKESFFVDPLLYLEYKRPADLTSSDVLEAKIILAKDFKQFNSSFNLIFEKELATSKDIEIKYSLGTSYQYIPQLKFGLELTGNLSGTDSQHQFGPTIAVASGELWTSFGVLWALTDKAKDLQIRAIIGLLL